MMHHRPAIYEMPDISIEASKLLLHIEKFFCVVNRGFDLRPIADDAVVFQQRIGLALAIASDFLGIEVGESLPIRVALAQHRVPTQARLCSLQRQKLKDQTIVMYGNAPFLIVISDVVGLAQIDPRTALGIFLGFYGHRRDAT